MVPAWSAMERVIAPTYSPGGIGGKLIAALCIQIFPLPASSDVAFLDQIQERHPAVGIFFGNADYQP